MTIESMVTQGDITTVRLISAVTGAEIDELKAQYGEVKSHIIELYKIRPTDAEVSDMKNALSALGVVKTGTWTEAAEAMRQADTLLTNAKIGARL